MYLVEKHNYITEHLVEEEKQKKHLYKRKDKEKCQSDVVVAMQLRMGNMFST